MSYTERCNGCHYFVEECTCKHPCPLCGTPPVRDPYHCPKCHALLALPDEDQAKLLAIVENVRRNSK